MKTKIEKIDRMQIDEAIMEEAGQIIKQGGLVAFPTETVYGLGANALDEVHHYAGRLQNGGTEAGL